jgi:hypothetical protein
VSGQITGDDMAAHSNITAERLRDVLEYDLITGNFTWKVRTGPRGKPGASAGTLNTRGYYEISVDGRKYVSHRLAWLYVNGKWPKGEIDHVNGCRDDNRWSNLRDVSRALNTQNRRSASANNSNGLLGVSRHGPRWRARIQVDGVVHRLGTYDSPMAAHGAYLIAKRRLHVACEI